MTIRPATISDAPAVVAFLHEFRAEGLQDVLQHPGCPTVQEEESFISRHDGTSGLMLLAFVEGRVVGCLTAEVADHAQLRHSCEFGMGVLQPQRGAGIGTAMMAQLIHWAQSAGLRRIELSVFACNVAAIRFYRRLGYADEGLRKEAVKIGGRYEDLVEMALRI